MKTYQCPNCSARVFFENLACLTCGCELGYSPGAGAMLPLYAAATTAQPCANRGRVACNWLVTNMTDAMDMPALCECCRYTRTIPPLNDVSHQQAWHALELAKRSLFYSLLALKLPIPDREQQPDKGLTFEFLAQLDEQNVLTGHADGVITINIAEADDLTREQRRVSLHEPYRTVLGHLRHEIGHFYWDQLIADSAQLDDFRALFGDERQDYATALQQHYQGVDDGSWQASYVSRYASSHPWEDWAECWAHYLHISDALDTAAAWRIGITTADAPLTPAAIIKATSDDEFKTQLIQQWLPLSQYLNAACRSLGEADAYPFILSPVVIDKLTFIHGVVRAA